MEIGLIGRLGPHARRRAVRRQYTVCDILDYSERFDSIVNFQEHGIAPVQRMAVCAWAPHWIHSCVIPMSAVQVSSVNCLSISHYLL